MRILSFILIIVALISCSKQEKVTQAQAETDSVAPAPVKKKLLKPELITLTEAEAQLVNWEIFRKLHNDLIADTDATAYIEEFTADDAGIHYKLIRHNGADTGLHFPGEQTEEDSDENADPDSYDADHHEPIYVAREGEDVSPKEETLGEKLGREGREMEERMAEQEAEKHKYDNAVYLNEFDSVFADLKYATYLTGLSDDGVKKITLVFEGEIRYPTSMDVTSKGEPKSGRYSIGLKNYDVTISPGTVVPPTDLYLKAKVAHLTNQDLAGKNKDELGFLRNEIFAHHGHTFKTDKMIDHFKDMKWYHPIVADAGPLLNDFEKRNVEFIKSKE